MRELDPRTLTENVFTLFDDRWTLITAGTREKCNTMTASWGGLGVLWNKPVATIYVRPQRYTYGFLEENDWFTLSFLPEDRRDALAYCGSNSGRDGDKFAACGLTRAELPPLKYAPGIAESPVCLGCRVLGRQELGSHILFLGEIVYLGIRPDLMDEQGKINLQKADLIAYSHGLYQSLSEPLGFFGFSVAAPGVLERRMAEIRDQARE